MPHDQVGKVRVLWSAAVRGLVASCYVLLVSAPVSAGETRWRLTKFDAGELMLAMTDTDDATDAIGSPYFRCKSGTALITVQSNMQDRPVRQAIADLILSDGYPTVQLLPGPERSAINEITSADDGGWGYRFQTDGDTAAFNSFVKTGYFQFKIGDAAVRAGAKAGLDKVAEFQAACRRLPAPSVSSRPKVQK